MKNKEKWKNKEIFKVIFRKGKERKGKEKKKGKNEKERKNKKEVKFW